MYFKRGFSFFAMINDENVPRSSLWTSKNPSLAAEKTEFIHSDTWIHGQAISQTNGSGMAKIETLDCPAKIIIFIKRTNLDSHLHFKIAYCLGLFGFDFL